MSTIQWLSRHTVMAPHLTLCLSEDEYLQAAKHCGIDSPLHWLDESRHQATTHTWDMSGKLTCVVCVHPGAKSADPIQVAASLTHEAVHVFQRLCDSIGEDQPSREFQAYSIERISEELMIEFARRVA